MDERPWSTEATSAPPIPRGKRLLDVVLGSIVVLAAAPVVGAAAVAMRLSGERGPILYRAIRIGEGGRPFVALKLRTMRPASSGGPITLAGDPRVTRVGRILRRYRIDELPQLINVVRGEMSLVGPRPEDPAYVDLSDPLHRYVFGARPGITGPSQIAFRDEAELLSGPDPDRTYRERVLPAKLALDAQYLTRQGVRTDLGILARTLVAVFSRGPSGPVR